MARSVLRPSLPVERSLGRLRGSGGSAARLLALLLSFAGASTAQFPPLPPGGAPNPIVWYLSGVRFSDGGTASGSFTFDANNWVCSGINITTTAGSSFGGAHYTALTGGMEDDIFAFVTLPGLSNYGGVPYLGIETFSLPLSNAGGTVPLFLPLSWETACADAACATLPASPARTVIAGSLTTTPPPSVPTLSNWALAVLGALLLGYSVVRIRAWLPFGRY